MRYIYQEISWVFANLLCNTYSYRLLSWVKIHLSLNSCRCLRDIIVKIVLLIYLLWTLVSCFPFSLQHSESTATHTKLVLNATRGTLCFELTELILKVQDYNATTLRYMIHSHQIWMNLESWDNIHLIMGPKNTQCCCPLSRDSGFRFSRFHNALLCSLFRHHLHLALCTTIRPL